MTTQTEALKLALEALEKIREADTAGATPKQITEVRKLYEPTITAIKEALAQPNEKEAALLRALEIIAVGDANNPQAQAAEELIALGYWRDIPEAIALAQPISSVEQEPVAWCEQSELDWLNSDKRGASAYVKTMLSKRKDGLAQTPLYTTPPQRKLLTDDEIQNLAYIDGGFDLIKFARLIEAAHGIKEVSDAC